MIALIVILLLFVLAFYCDEWFLPESSVIRKRYADLEVFTTTRGVMSYYDTKKGNETILLLHGYSSCYVTWEEMIDYYEKKGYRVLAPELFGNGFSDKDDSFDYSVTFFSEQILEFIAAMNLGSFHLMGHSMGGAIAIDIAQALQTRVKTAILIAPAGFGSLKGKNALMRLAAFWPLLRFFFFLRRLPLVVRLSVRVVALDFSVKKADRYFDRFHRFMMTRGYTRMFFSLARSINSEEWNRTTMASRLTLPVLIIHGTADRILPWKGSFVLHRFIAHSRIVMINNGAHSVMETDPLSVTKAIEDWSHSLK